MPKHGKFGIADRSFPGTHPKDCDCARCKAKRELEEKRERARSRKREARKRSSAAFFAVFGERVAKAWATTVGFANAALSIYTVAAIVVIVAVMVMALWEALQTGGEQWIVALCCVPGLIVVVWLNERLGIE